MQTLNEPNEMNADLRHFKEEKLQDLTKIQNCVREKERKIEREKFEKK